MSREELDFIEYFHKFAERAQLTSIALRDGKDPDDDQWDLLEAVHGLYFNGRLMYYKTILEADDTPSVQSSLPLTD